MAIYNAEPRVTMASVQISSDGLSTIAFVTPSSIDSEAWLTRLGNRLTQYLIPSAIFSVDHLPKTTNDKVGHKAIAAGREDFIRVTQSTKNGQLSQKKQSQSSIVEKSTQLRDFRPSTKVENTTALRVARIWQDTLALQEIPNLDANIFFFKVRGHRYVPKQICLIHADYNSLLMPRLHQDIQREFPRSSIKLIESPGYFDQL